MELFEIPDNREKVILPVKYPIITTYTYHAHILSILCNHEEPLNWIYSNYIQLYINKDYNYPWGDFYFPCPFEIIPAETCKWLLTQKMDRDYVNKKWGSIIDFLIENIQLGNYMNIMLNYFHIPNNDAYGKMNYIHDMLIYGFDSSKEIFYTSDFFSSGKYSFEKVKFDDIKKAFDSYYLGENADYRKGLVYLYKFNDKCDYDFCIKNIINFIKSYLYSQAPEYFLFYNEWQHKKCIYGIAIYRTLINYIEREKNNSNPCIDIRPFYLLYDHKKLMCMRLEYLKQNKLLNCSCMEDVISVYSSIEKMSHMCVNILIRHIYTSKLSDINKVSELLYEIEKKELSALTQLVSEYESCSELD